jgi:GH24 family phage-related lysozyme (muramidase)
MHSAVEQAWPAVAREHEGVVHWPYLDTVNKVTVGIGLLIEADNQPTEECFSLPWTVDGQPATRAQIAAGWAAVNSHTELAGHATQFETVSRLRLSDQAINGALMAKTREFWSDLTSQLVNLEEWPADAQLGLLDLAYQLGPWFLGASWPNFTAGAHASDFIRCASNCAVRQASAERNTHRSRLFRNAALVVGYQLDPARLWDTEVPQEDDMLTDAQITQLAEKVADIVAPQVEAAVTAQLKTVKAPPTPAAIAAAVLDSAASDVIPVAGTRGKVRPKTALSEIHKAVTGR